MCSYSSTTPDIISTGDSCLRYVLFIRKGKLLWADDMQFPCLFLFLLGLSIWLNFRWLLDSKLYQFYPIILIGITVFVMVMPLPIFYLRSRLWLIHTCVSADHLVRNDEIIWIQYKWRLFCAGLYPVQFRDFFLGDLLCSQTYSFGVSALPSALTSEVKYRTRIPFCSSAFMATIGQIRHNADRPTRVCLASLQPCPLSGALFSAFDVITTLETSFPISWIVGNTFVRCYFTWALAYIELNKHRRTDHFSYFVPRSMRPIPVSAPYELLRSYRLSRQASGTWSWIGVRILKSSLNAPGNIAELK